MLFALASTASRPAACSRTCSESRSRGHALRRLPARLSLSGGMHALKAELIRFTGAVERLPRPAVALRWLGRRHGARRGCDGGRLRHRIGCGRVPMRFVPAPGRPAIVTGAARLPCLARQPADRSSGPASARRRTRATHGGAVGGALGRRRPARRRLLSGARRGTIAAHRNSEDNPGAPRSERAEGEGAEQPQSDASATARVTRTSALSRPRAWGHISRRLIVLGVGGRSHAPLQLVPVGVLR